MVKTKGDGERIVVGKPKSGKARVVDVDERTLAALRAQRKTVGTLSLALARDDAYMLGAVDGRVRHPERFSQAFRNRIERVRREMGDDAVPAMVYGGA